ncbi:hypothetical protein SAMN05444920_10254 [Nonomuraea solani]|uniref:Lipoprotein n=1 Tax=Nonomuraea solani TaxID=1144553 RepID=A0A1H5XXE4_9ACTN|nr:hypothetical protein [Nonomuraea solani]SEG16215.1 hypothetical protein SAMN05444920_10254 [Nonomuraea solani]
MSVRLRRAVGVLLAATAACSATPPPQVPPPGAEARALSIPFDRYNLSPSDISVLEGAEELLVRDCMRGRGMAWEVLPRSAAEDVEPANRRRYGVVEPEIARLFGYHTAPDRPTVARRAAAGADRMRGLSAKERQAAYGEKDGCLAQARAHLEQGAPQVDEALFNRLISETFERSRRDPKVVQVFRDWSACMREQGRQYADPLAAVTDRRWMTDGPASPDESRAAQADVRCKVKTGLVAVWSAAEKRIQDEAISAHPAEFEALRATKDQQLSAARAVLARA